MDIAMCMLWLDTSLKAIHNFLSDKNMTPTNVYAMIRYKFESNSQHDAHVQVGDEECVCYD